MQINSARYINADGWYDATVAPADGEPFQYTVDPSDPAELAVAIRSIVESEQIPIAPFVEPPPRVPKRVSAAQAKLALDAVIVEPGEEVADNVFVGRVTLLDQVEALIAAFPVRAVRIWFVDANNWERGHPYVSALGLEMDLDDEAIDALFIAAARY